MPPATQTIIRTVPMSPLRHTIWTLYQFAFIHITLLPSSPRSISESKLVLLFEIRVHLAKLQPGNRLTPVLLFQARFGLLEVLSLHPVR